MSRIILVLNSLQAVSVGCSGFQGSATNDVAQLRQGGVLLTKLRALRATSSTITLPHLVDVLNAFGLFARTEPDRPSTSVACGLLSTGAGASTFHRGARRR